MDDSENEDEDDGDDSDDEGFKRIQDKRNKVNLRKKGGFEEEDDENDGEFDHDSFMEQMLADMHSKQSDELDVARK